ncbi:MAG: response regulator [Thermoguttaceae bacterium]
MCDKTTVFVVDDDPAARESATAVIQSRGMYVEAYASAEAFLDQFDRERLGCLVTDMKMGGMSGLDLQEKLRTENVALPVIVVTGYGNVSTAMRAMRAGAVAMLEKPCRSEDLWQSIRDAIDSHRKQRQSRSRRDELQSRLARLTPGERDVLDQIKADIPNKVIASRLDVGLRTVELRRAAVMKKMEADSLPELIQLLMELEP